MCTLNDPAASTIARLGFQVVSFLAATLYMRRVVTLAKISTGSVRIVSLVEAKMLLLASRRLGAFDRFAVESRFEDLVVMRIGAADF